MDKFPDSIVENNGKIHCFTSFMVYRWEAYTAPFDHEIDMDATARTQAFGLRGPDG